MVVRVKKGNSQLPSSLLPCCDRTRPVRKIISVPFATLPTWSVHPGSRRGSPLLGAHAMLPPGPHARRRVPLHPVSGGVVLLTRTTLNPLLCFLFSGADAVTQPLRFTVSLCWGDFSLPKCERSFILPGHIRSGFAARSGLSLSLWLAAPDTRSWERPNQRWIVKNSTACHLSSQSTFRFVYLFIFLKVGGFMAVSRLFVMVESKWHLEWDSLALKSELIHSSAVWSWCPLWPLWALFQSGLMTERSQTVSSTPRYFWAWKWVP